MPDTNDILARGKQRCSSVTTQLPVIRWICSDGYGCGTARQLALDLFAGFGGCVLGHCHPALVEAATNQAKKLWHVGNTFYTEPQIEVAERLNRLAFAGKAFFCHVAPTLNEKRPSSWLTVRIGEIAA